MPLFDEYPEELWREEPFYFVRNNHSVLGQNDV